VLWLTAPVIKCTTPLCAQLPCPLCNCGDMLCVL
jgi:hypothetical protein